MIKFQDEIITKIDSYTIDTLPHTIILNGPKGCGKHLVTNYIASRFNLLITDFSDKNVSELKISLDDAFERVEPYLYILDCNALGTTWEKKQNTILKFIEEPLNNTFIIMLTENVNSLLTTVQNRAQIINFKPYSKAQLNTFLTVSNDLLLSLADTPGQIIENENNDLSSMVALGNIVFEKIGIANYQNTLSIADKINFKDESDKFDLNLFIKLLLKICTEDVINSEDWRYQKSLELTCQLSSEIKNLNLNKRYLFEKYLIELKKVWTYKN